MQNSTSAPQIAPSNVQVTYAGTSFASPQFRIIGLQVSDSSILSESRDCVATMMARDAAASDERETPLATMIMHAFIIRRTPLHWHSRQKSGQVCTLHDILWFNRQ
jgi:hypothetical protein